MIITNHYMSYNLCYKFHNIFRIVSIICFNTTGMANLSNYAKIIMSMHIGPCGTNNVDI